MIKVGKCWKRHCNHDKGVSWVCDPQNLFVLFRFTSHVSAMICRWIFFYNLHMHLCSSCICIFFSPKFVVINAFEFVFLLFLPKCALAFVLEFVLVFVKTCNFLPKCILAFVFEFVFVFAKICICICVRSCSCICWQKGCRLQ